ncbi:MAG TPA: CoA pyrophosphatase [Cellvibrio sp.]|jgi:8-oxo-dGTP pyrophosphatase MutT (NUDIX family)|nr:CoA pyrophosphatase [Cellvibrio sp.]
MRPLWQYLQNYLQPNHSLTQQVGLYPAQASVMVLFTDAENPEMIFTLRAQHLTNHPGEVAFPGGMWETGDNTLLDTALRESHEEIGLSPAAVKLLGACKPRATRAGVRVTPFVGLIDPAIELVPSPDELDAVFRVPLSAFRAGIQTRTDIFSHAGKSWRVPAYQHEGYEIWGFTAALTQEIITAVLNATDEVLPIE